MAGVKGRSGSGGARPGAGRPKKEAKTPVEAAPASGVSDDPLAYLIQVMKDPAQEAQLRVRAAITVAQYKYLKKGDGGKKEEKGERAEKANAGLFAPAQAPRLVVDNTKAR
jgi:phage terminase small subunit